MTDRYYIILLEIDGCIFAFFGLSSKENFLQLKNNESTNVPGIMIFHNAASAQAFISKMAKANLDLADCYIVERKAYQLWSSRINATAKTRMLLGIHYRAYNNRYMIGCIIAAFIYFAVLALSIVFSPK